MKKAIILMFVLMIAAFSVMSASAAPRGRYYDQLGNKHWCNSDSDGCWVTGENGEHEYIMFWSEAAREKYMGAGSNAPVGEYVESGKMTIEAPKSDTDSDGSSGGRHTCDKSAQDSCNTRSTGSEGPCTLEGPDASGKCECKCTNVN